MPCDHDEKHWQDLIKASQPQKHTICKHCGKPADITEQCDDCWEVTARLDDIKRVALFSEEFTRQLLDIVVESGMLADYRIRGDEPKVFTNAWWKQAC